MDDKSLITKYENFLKLNKLELSQESAKDFIDLEEGPSLMELSMEYVRKGGTMQTKTTKLKYFKNALAICPDNFAAKITIIETEGYNLDRYKEALDIEYDRLLAQEYLDPKYYPNNLVDFSKYQDTFNYLRGLRSYYITLIAQEHYDMAINVGAMLLELNPSDHFHVISSQCFLYLKIKDTLSALSLFKEKSNPIIGTKELVYAYASFLNNDMKKSLDYLEDLEAINPYLYRLVTGEIAFDGNTKLEAIYSDSLYVYLGFVTIGKDLHDFEPLVKRSKDDHPILKSLTKDELDFLKVSAFEDLTYYNIDFIRKAAKNYHLVDYVSNFSDGRMESILVALASRGILKDSRLTTYGKIVMEYLEEYLFNESIKLKEEALEALNNNDNELAIAKIKAAMDYAPHDYFLKEMYLFQKEPFDYHYARNLIHEMGMLYKDFESFKSYSTIEIRQRLEEAMDEIHFMYYSNAYKEKRIIGLIDAYLKFENQFNKYTNLIQMAQYLNGDILPNDSTHLFYNLYKDYKEKGILSYDGIKDLLKKSKLEYADYKRNTGRIPYGILDEKFERNYIGALEVLSLGDIITKDELEVLKIIDKGGKPMQDASLSYSFLLHSFKLEKEFFIKEKNHKNTYTLEDFVSDYFINKD